MRTRLFNGKEQVYCEWRQKWVRLTPEEWVRQQLLHRLVEQLGYPASLIGVEISIRVGEVQKRCDAVVYDRMMNPWMLIECKAETVPLTQKTLDQALIYNRRLGVPYLLLHNGKQSIMVQVRQDGITILPSVPPFADNQ